MMFSLHIAFSLVLLVILASVVVITWADHHNHGLAKTIAIIVLILSVSNALCMTYYGIRYWSEGYYDRPFPMMHK